MTITSATPDATIFYTTDGTNPNAGSTVYSGPISVATTTTIRAMASKAGFQNSVVAVGQYIITAPPPGTLSDVTITPGTGIYANPQSVGMTIPAAEAPATICYTLDGSNPTCDVATAACTGTSATYSAGAPLQVDAPTGGGTVKVRALACKVGSQSSVNIQESALSFKVADPTATLPAPTESPVPVGSNITLGTVTAGVGTNVHYRTDGTAPNCNASVGGAEQSCGVNNSACLVPITQNTVLQAVGCKPNYQPSGIVTFNYTVQVQTPQLDTGVYFNDLTAAASDSTPADTTKTPAAWWCFGTGATAPTCSTDGVLASPASANGCATGSATAPDLTTDTTVNAVGCKVGFAQSAPISGTYTLKVGTVRVIASSAGTYSNCGGGVCTDENAANFWAGGATTSFSLDTATVNSGTTVFIRYTTDGTTVPSCEGAATAVNKEVAKGDTIEPDPTDAFTRIQAVGCKPGYNPSDLRTLSYADPDLEVQLAAISPPTLTTSDNKITVLMSTTPPAGVTPTTAHICYNVGQAAVAAPDCDPLGDPTLAQGLCTGSTRYNPAAPFSVDASGHEVKAIACKTGVPQKSVVVSQIFTLKMGTPTATNAADNTGTPIGATYAYGQTIYWHTTSEATKTGEIEYHWTTDAGLALSCTTGNVGPSTVFTPANNQPVTYRVIACDTANKFLPSEPASFTISGFLGAPTYNRVNGFTFNDEYEVVTSAPGADYICYTKDGSTPACVGGGTCSPNATIINSSTGPILVNVHATTLHAVACKNTGFQASTVGSGGPFNIVVDAPNIVPADGQQFGPVTIQVFAVGTPNQRICTSINGADIDANCTASASVTCTNGVAPGTMVLELADHATNVDVKARACKTNPPTTVSALASTQTAKSYSFTPYTRTINITDGFDDWSTFQNALPSEVDDGNNSAYLSWDADWLYFGYRGPFLTNSTTRYMNIYLTSASGALTTLKDDRLGATKFGPDDNGNLPQVPGGVNFHFFVRTDRLEAPGTSMWDGANWVDGAGTAPYACGHGGGSLGTSAALVECKVSRAALGLTGSATLQFSGNLSDTAAPGPGIFPHDNFPFTAGGHGYWTGNLGTNIPADPARWQTGVAPGE